MPVHKSSSRRSVLTGAFGGVGIAAFDAAAQQQRVGANAPISPKDNLKVTGLETFLVKPRWLFLKVHTNAGIVGYGELITEVRLIAGMAEAYYASIAPHNPLGPISLAAGVQLAASIPNFLCQEQVSLGEGYLKKPFTVRDGYLDLPTDPGLGIESRRKRHGRQDQSRLEESGELRRR